MDKNRVSKAGPPAGPAPGRTGIRSHNTRQLPAAAQEKLRLQAIRLLSAGSSQAEAAKELGVSRQAVHQWARISRERGSSALRADRRGRPRSRPLLPWHEVQILRAVTLFPPARLDLPFRCWTREAIVKLADRWFGIRLSRWMVGSYLKRWGFTPQRSVRYLFRHTPPRLLQWLDGVQYPENAPGTSSPESSLYSSFTDGVLQDGRAEA
jgi:transposase